LSCVHFFEKVDNPAPLLFINMHPKRMLFVILACVILFVLGNASPKQQEAKQRAVWTELSVRCLFESFSSHYNRTRQPKKRKSQIFNLVSIDVSKEIGMPVSSEQCSGKFFSLLRLYNNYIDQVGQTGVATPKKFQFFDLVHEYFGEKPQTKPLALVSSMHGYLVPEAAPIGEYTMERD
jgi:hypothetical protein